MIVVLCVLIPHCAQTGSVVFLVVMVGPVEVILEPQIPVRVMPMVIMIAIMVVMLMLMLFVRFWVTGADRGLMRARRPASIPSTSYRGDEGRRDRRF